MYAVGGLVPQNYAEAAEWFRLAAEQGDADAQHIVGNMYDHGKGVPQNYTETVKWYHLAAAQGHGSAQSDLSTLYALGHGVPQDFVMAYVWASMAARQGYKNAIKNTGIAAKQLTPEQRDKGLEIIVRCFESKFIDCK